jgi:hypothetical protein
LQQRNGAPALNLLIDHVVVDGAALADHAEHRNRMAQAQRRHLAGAGEQSGIADDGDRAHAAEECAGADSDSFGFAAHRDVAYNVVAPHTPDQSIEPIVGQCRGKTHAGLYQLRMNLIVDVHGLQHLDASLAPSLSVWMAGLDGGA